MDVSYTLLNNLAQLYDFNKNVIGQNGSYVRKVRDKYPADDARPLLKDYIHWLELQNWIEDVNNNVFNPKGKLFQKFIEYASNNYIGVDVVKGTPLWM